MLFRSICATVPAVNNIAADSPTTRPTDKITPDNIPGIALGNTTLYNVWNLVEPKAKDASLYPSGTVFKASSVVLIITGNIIIATVRAPDNIEYFKFKTTTKKIPPNNPYIIDGIPAKLSVANLIAFTNLPFLAYSCKYIADKIPIGVAIAIESITVYNVVTIIGSIPPLPLAE